MNHLFVDDSDRREYMLMVMADHSFIRQRDRGYTLHPMTMINDNKFLLMAMINDNPFLPTTMIEAYTVLLPMTMVIGTVSPAACWNSRPKVKYINCYPLVKHPFSPHTKSSQSVPISQNSVRRPFGHGHPSTPLRPIVNRRFFHINLHRTNFYFSSAYHVVSISSRHGVDFSSTAR